MYLDSRVQFGMVVMNRLTNQGEVIPCLLFHSQFGRWLALRLRHDQPRRSKVEVDDLGLVPVAVPSRFTKIWASAGEIWMPGS